MGARRLGDLCGSALGEGRKTFELAEKLKGWQRKAQRLAERPLGHDEEAAAGVAVGFLAALDFLLGGAEDFGAADAADAAA